MVLLKIPILVVGNDHTFAWLYSVYLPCCGIEKGAACTHDSAIQAANPFSPGEKCLKQSGSQVPVHTLPRAFIFYFYTFTRPPNRLLFGAFKFWLLPGYLWVLVAKWPPPGSCFSSATSWLLLLFSHHPVPAAPWTSSSSCSLAIF